MPTVLGVTLGAPPPAHANCPDRMIGVRDACYRADLARADQRTLILYDKIPSFTSGRLHLHLASDGTVDGIDIMTGGLSSQSAALQALIVKFGSPTKTVTSKAQNLAGASFDTVSAFWVKPDCEVDFVGVAHSFDDGDISVSTTALHQQVEREIKSRDAPL